MRILVIGAEGTVGKAVVHELGRRHDIVTAGRSSGEASAASETANAPARILAAPVSGNTVCASTAMNSALAPARINAAKP